MSDHSNELSQGPQIDQDIDQFENNPKDQEQQPDMRDSTQQDPSQNQSKKDQKHKKHKKSKKRTHREGDEQILGGLDNLDEIAQLEEEVKRLQQEDELERENLQLNPFFEEDDEENEQRSEQQQYSEEYEEENQDRHKRKRSKRKVVEQKEKAMKKRIVKIQRKVEEIQEEESKLQNYNPTQKEVYNKIKTPKTQKRKNDDIDLEEDSQSSMIAQDLIDRMHMAFVSDKECYEQGKPGLRKLLMAKEVYENLRKISVQEKFLEQGGCRVLAEWLDMLPDGTFPNFNLVQGLLNSIQSLRIDANQLEESGLAPIVQYYEVGSAKMPELQKLAKQIIDKWSRQLYDIKSEYDAEGKFDQTYRQYQEKLSIQKEKHAIIQQLQEQSRKDKEKETNDEADDQNDDISPKPKKKRNINDIDDKKQISRGRMGIMLPERNAFDFVLRPERREDIQRDKKKDSESGKQRLQKTLLQLKKSNTKPTTTKGMATVKMNY